ncbi:MAG: hypothetical protein ABFS12_01520 [Bacteroidota bacterium]
MKIILLFLFISTGLFAQSNITISDTIDVVTLQKFNVPEDRNIVLTNIKQISIQSELLDSEFNKIRDVDEIFQTLSSDEVIKKSKDGRGVMVQVVANEAIEEPGAYYIKININYIDEQGKGFASAYYQINVSYPQVNSKINLRENYFYSEKETMSFATSEFADPNGYSFEIIDQAGNVLSKGNSSIVSLNSVFNNIKNVGKEITIKGYYKEKQFFYEYNGAEVHKSEWTIRLNKPNLEEFNDWKKANPNDRIAISAWNKNAMRLLYTYTGNTPNGFAVVYPEINNFKFKGEPSELFNKSKYSRAGNFLYVSFDLNKEYLAELEDCAEQPVRISIEFTTQFDEKVEKVYEGIILK